MLVAFLHLKLSHCLKPKVTNEQTNCCSSSQSTDPSSASSVVTTPNRAYALKSFTLACFSFIPKFRTKSQFTQLTHNSSNAQKNQVFISLDSNGTIVCTVESSVIKTIKLDRRGLPGPNMSKKLTGQKNG